MIRPKTTEHTVCQILRRRLTLQRTTHAATGRVLEQHEHWVTEPCGTPLVTPETRTAGECSSCAAGWTSPFNYRV